MNDTPLQSALPSEPASTALASEPERRSHGGMWIICAGMRRGGSTVQTQLTAAIAQARDMRVMPLEAIAVQIASGRPTEPVVIKVHEFVPQCEAAVREGRLKVIYVYRDLRDVVVSLMRKNGDSFASVAAGLRALVRESESWMNLRGILVSRYETMTADLAHEAMRIAAYLGVSLKQEDAERIAAEMSLDRQKQRVESFDYASKGVGQGLNIFNPETLLHANHIHSGDREQWRRSLTAWQVALLEWRIGPWLTAHGYKLSSSPMRRLLAALGYGSYWKVHGLLRRSVFSGRP